MPPTDTDMGLAVPKHPHALLGGVSSMHAGMSATLAGAGCALCEALAQPEAVRAVFYGVDAALYHIDHLMHAFFADAKAGQLAQAVVLERAAEQGACARVTSWLERGGAVLPSIVEAKYELEHAARTLHQLQAEYDAPACMSLSDALTLACTRASSRCSAQRARRWPRAACQTARRAALRAHCGRVCSSATTRPSGAWRRRAERGRHTALTRCS